MLVVGFPAQAFATNCWVVAPAEGEECVIVDPGIGVMAELAQTLAAHRLRPAAVLLTHGHVDHVYAVTPVCGGYGVAAHIHDADAYRLADPLATLDPALVAMLERQFGAKAAWREPDDVRRLRDGEVLNVAGMAFTVDHAPGHTEGSVLYRTAYDDGLDGLGAAPAGVAAGADGRLCLSGDVLFAGSVGRTDLPGGDPSAMLVSLATKVLPLPDETVVLPGHGPGTTIGRERLTNPFLQGLVDRSAGDQAPGRR